MSKEIKYKGCTITVEKITGWVATIENEKGEIITDSDESASLLDYRDDAIEWAKEIIDIYENPELLQPPQEPGHPIQDQKHQD